MSGEHNIDCKGDRSNDLVFQEYKRYKKKKPTPDFSEVIDFCNVTQFQSFWTELEVASVLDSARYCKVGLKNASQWKVYELKSCPGFLFVPNPFISASSQSYWTMQALTAYTKKPFPSNLDVHVVLDPDKSVWQISREKSSDNSFIQQLRWSHLGYHFDYNIVDYKSKRYFGFPEDLASLTSVVAETLGYRDYFPETGIVNYYPSGSSMGGHTDHYEEELGQPLISFSFGQAAVFLIGGHTRSIKPEAIWVRSGDVLLMTGPSRTAYHAVPCIITKRVQSVPNDIPGCSLVVDPSSRNTCLLGATLSCGESCSKSHIWNDCLGDNVEWRPFSEYLSNTRININIRQVHKALVKEEVVS